MNDKRRVLIGKDLSVKKKRELFEGVDQQTIDDAVKDMTNSQKSFIQEYRGDLHNGIGLMQGGPRRGTSSVVKTIAELGKP